MPDRDIPKDVDRYFKETKKGNPDYDDAQAWATAWSRFCKYKNPGSDHCQQPASAYFPGKSASPLRLRRDYGSEDTPKVTEAPEKRLVARYKAKRRG